MIGSCGWPGESAPSRSLTVEVLGGLEDSTISALLTWETEDPFAPSTEQEHLARVLAEVTIRPYPGTGHAVHWEQPARFADDLMEWSARCTS